MSVSFKMQIRCISLYGVLVFLLFFIQLTNTPYGNYSNFVFLKMSTSAIQNVYISIHILLGIFFFERSQAPFLFVLFRIELIFRLDRITETIEKWYFLVPGSFIFTLNH